MADRTSIEWTDATWNPFGGCSRASEGCRNCYAEIMAARFSDPGQWGHGLARRVTLPDGGTDHRWTGHVVLHEHKLDQPLRWQKPRRIFVNSTSDTFHESVPDEWLDRLFAVMALAPHHTFQVLTKRPERARAYLSQPGRVGDVLDACLGYLETPGHVKPRRIEDGIQLLTLPNVWFGTSVEDQATADARIPHLLATPAAVRFISAEPLLGPVDLTAIPRTRAEGFMRPLDGRFRTIDWVICGGESGPGARPMHPDWARSLRDQCQAAGVAFFFKQWGEWGPAIGMAVTHRWDGDTLHQFDGGRIDGPGAARVGKARAGRLLDGLTWDQMPEGRG